MTRKHAAALCAAMIGLGALTPPADAMPSRILPAAANSETAPMPVAHRRGFYAVGGVYYYNGHRGYYRARPGYRYYNGHWFPAAAFAAGVATGAAIAGPPPAPPVARLAAAHVRWCHLRYQSYRAWDNSYQPYAGPRRQCWSPYS
jgi:hypothetical protein